jgi:hypothetical protein
MNTKKLVLGFCVLAAVTGEFWGNAVTGTEAAPQVFGNEAVTGRGAPAVSVLMSPSEMLTEAFPDEESRAQYVDGLNVLEREAKANADKLVEVGNDEVNRVKSALSSEHRAHLLGELAIRDVKLVDEKKIARIQRDLEKAEKRVERAWFFVEWRKAKVEKLKLKLADAEQKRDRMLEQVAALCHTANGCIDKAQQHRSAASALHTQRVAAITNACALLPLSINGIRADEDRLHAGLAITDLQELALKIIGYIVVAREADRVLAATLRGAECLRNAFHEGQYDYDWFSGGNRGLYETLMLSYEPKMLGYNYYYEAFDEHCQRFRDFKQSVVPLVNDVVTSLRSQRLACVVSADS